MRSAGSVIKVVLVMVLGLAFCSDVFAQRRRLVRQRWIMPITSGGGYTLPGKGKRLVNIGWIKPITGPVQFSSGTVSSQPVIQRSTGTAPSAPPAFRQRSGPIWSGSSPLPKSFNGNFDGRRK